MLPIGLQFQKFKPIRKLPMRLEPISFEAQKKRYYTLLNLESTEKKTKGRERKQKPNSKNKTKKRT